MLHVHALTRCAVRWHAKKIGRNGVRNRQIFITKRGVDLISDAFPSGRLWYSTPDAIANAIRYVEHRRRSHDAVFMITLAA